LLLNFNSFTQGQHTVEVRANGQFLGSSTFSTVQSGGVEYLRNVSRQVKVPDFPSYGLYSTLNWIEDKQNFAVTSISSSAIETPIPVKSSPPTNYTGTAAIESPSNNSVESGIGIIRGWHCNASRIEAVIDGKSIGSAPVGSDRPDTAGICGKTNNGFSLLINYNSLIPGNHNIKYYSNGQLFSESNFISLQSGNADYLRFVSKQVKANDFPSIGVTSTITWIEDKQNFSITSQSRN